MDAVTLSAGESSDWFNMSGFVGADVVLTLKIAGGGIAAINVSCSDDHAEANDAVETFAASAARVLQRPLPNFIQIKNTSTGTVVFAFGHGVQCITAEPPPTT